MGSVYIVSSGVISLPFISVFQFPITEITFSYRFLCGFIYTGLKNIIFLLYRKMEKNFSITYYRSCQSTVDSSLKLEFFLLQNHVCLSVLFIRGSGVLFWVRKFQNFHFVEAKSSSELHRRIWEVFPQNISSKRYRNFFLPNFNKNFRKFSNTSQKILYETKKHFQNFSAYFKKSQQKIF